MSFEPEYIWTTKSGLPAFIRINQSGFRCGYVAVSFSPLLSSLTETYYPNWGKPFSPLDPLYDAFNGISIHGGITFNDPIDGARFIGFDCAHYEDAPIPEYASKYFAPSRSTGIVRSLDYCIDECESLAGQLVSIHQRYSYLLDEFPEEFL